jgi:hypothetical protein
MRYTALICLANAFNMPCLANAIPSFAYALPCVAYALHCPCIALPFL